MKLDTHEVTYFCYTELQRRHPARAVTAKELSKEICAFYNMARNGLIDTTAERLDRLFGLRLLEWGEQIFKQLFEVDEEWYWDTVNGDWDPDDPEEGVYGNAFCLAILLFFRSMERGHILYSFDMSEAEAAAWLDRYAVPIHSNPAQRSLFAVMGGA